MKKNYIIPKTQVKTVSTESLMAGSLRVDRNTIVPDDAGGFAKKGFSIWEEN